MSIKSVLKKIIPSFIFKFFQPFYHYSLSLFGRVFYGFAGKDMFVVGVTGTKGKTTTVEFMNAIMEEAGKKTAILSSIYKKIDNKREKKDFDNTMPGRLYIPKFLKKAKKAGCEYVFIEVTSQGVEQFRHKFIDWNMAVFLNLHPEHIESHGSFENYREAKLKFFRSLKNTKSNSKNFLINGEDNNSVYFKEAAKEISSNEREIIIFSIDDVYRLVENIKKEENVPDGVYSDFNLENLAAAVVFAKLRGIQYQTILKAMSSFKGLPGRLEFVSKNPYSVVVDYAHTPDSLRALYKNLRENYNMAKDGRLICVLGSAGGGRDKWKRPEMGKVAAIYSDYLILTSEDPYNEDPIKIINDIKKGVDSSIDKPSKLIEELDRKKAIELAIYEAKKGDIVVITGMGSQSWFYGKNGKIAWNETEIAKNIFEKYNN
jgi:UDP-N-acetylmuramoyl-L-alanyl-D-glutamate--2,6-diaminopimelate ligase